jgi:hypothetical protein
MPPKMPKPPRQVAVALIFSPDTHQILMVTSRKHPDLWIRELVPPPKNQLILLFCTSHAS